jgi:hypothetical protein
VAAVGHTTTDEGGRMTQETSSGADDLTDGRADVAAGAAGTGAAGAAGVAAIRDADPDAELDAGPGDDTGFGGEPTTEAASATGWDSDAVDEDAVS